MVIRPCTIIDTLVIGLPRIDDVCSGFATENLERQMFGVAQCAYGVSRGSCVLLRRRFRLPELISIDIACAPTAERESAYQYQRTKGKGTGRKI